MEMRGHPAIAGNPASKGIRDPLADAGTVAVEVMPIAAVAPIAAVGAAEAAEIAAVEKGGDEEFQ